MHATLASVSGLPLHPLTVHVPVVLLPLGAVGLAIVLAAPRWRKMLAWPVLAIIAIGTIGAVVAMVSGNALAAETVLPAQHQQLGTWLVGMSIALLASSLAWWMWERRALQRRRSTGIVGTLLAIVLGALAAATLVVAVLTGHSGAESVWGEADPSAPSASQPVEDEQAAPGTTSEAISLGVVAQHDDSASCWAAIDGTVYNLTEWIEQHPGGADRILSICGTDATDRFQGQHGGQAGPTDSLAQFAIGELAE